jgi:membrane protease YdiL (CAAX protease family)
MAALLPLFVFGLVLVALYEFTGSIWAPVAVHFLFNAATVVVQMLLRFADLPQPPGS